MLARRAGYGEIGSGLMLVRKRLYIGLGVLGLALLAGLLCTRHQPEVVAYRGRPVRDWALQVGAADAGRREEAGVVLQELGTNAVPELLKMLGARDSFLRLGFWRLTQKLPGQAQIILGRLTRPPEGVRLRTMAARCLGMLGPKAEKAVPALAAAMRTDQVREVCAEAAGALGRIRGPAIPELTSALADKKPYVRYVAIGGVGELGPEAAAAAPALFKALEDDDNIRVPAGLILSRLGPTVLPLVTNGLQSADGPTRRRAAKAVACIRQPRDVLLPLLLDLLRSPDAADRQQALETLCMMGLPTPRMVNAYLGALKDREAPVRLAAARALSTARLQAKAAVGALAEALDDPSPAVRELAARVLGTFGSRGEPAAAGLRRRAETDREPQVRAAAKEALGRIEPGK